MVGAVETGAWMFTSGGGMNGGGGVASFGGGGGGVSGGGFLISSMILVSIGAFSTSTTLRASPFTSAQPSTRWRKTTMVMLGKCFTGLRSRSA
jgi:hypothetical protein